MAVRDHRGDPEPPLSVRPGSAERVTGASRIVAFRNRLIHGYATVSDEVVWSVIESSLPLLEDEVAGLLLELGGDGCEPAEGDEGAER